MTIARGSFAGMIELAGGSNVAADLLPGMTGEISLEHILTHPPDVYLATGGVYNGRGGVVLGSGVEPAAAQASLRSVLASRGLRILPAVQEGRAHALWHGFNETPLHVLALERMAGWFHPQAQAALQPEAGLEECNRRFAAVPLEGCFWCSA